MLLEFAPQTCADTAWQATAGMPLRIAVAVALVGIAGWASARRSFAGQGSFVAMLLAMVGWIAVSTAEHAAVDPVCKGTLAISNWLFIQPQIAFTALFFYQHLNQAPNSPPWRTRILFALPVLGFMAVALTNGEHGLFYGPNTAVSAPIFGMPRLLFERGPMFHASTLLIYAFLIASIGLIVQGWRQSTGLRRLQWSGFAAAISVPVLANIAYLGMGWRFLGGDPTNTAFAASAVGLAWSMQRYQLFNVAPMAHRALFAELPDPVLVLDDHQHVIEANQAAQRLVRSDASAQPAGDLAALNGEPLAHWPRIGFALQRHLQASALLDDSQPTDPPIARLRREPLARARSSTTVARRPIDGSDTPHHPSVLQLIDPPAWFEVQSRPLVRHGRVHGTLVQLHDVSVHHRAQAESVRALAARDVELGKATALQALLREQAMHDPLTGLLNRRALEERFAQERAESLGGPVLAGLDPAIDRALVLVLIDLDHFKRVNDTHGHPVGDAVLRDLAAALRSGLRASDALFRLGGEEFAMLMSGTEPEVAVRRVDALREIVAAWKLGGLAEPITFSAGVARGDPRTNTLQHLMDAADAALYQAKRGGRNRTEVAGSVSGLVPG